MGETTNYAGIAFLILGLICLGSWPAFMRGSLLHRPASFKGIDELPWHPSYLQLDFVNSYFLVSTMPFLLAFTFSDNPLDLVKDIPWSLIGCAMLGGLFLAFGLCMCQWIEYIHGPQLPLCFLLQHSLALVIATFLNYQLDSNHTLNVIWLVIGFLCLITAICLHALVKYLIAEGVPEEKNLKGIRNEGDDVSTVMLGESCRSINTTGDYSIHSVRSKASSPVLDSDEISVTSSTSRSKLSQVNKVNTARRKSFGESPTNSPATTFSNPLLEALDRMEMEESNPNDAIEKPRNDAREKPKKDAREKPRPTLAEFRRSPATTPNTVQVARVIFQFRKRRATPTELWVAILVGISWGLFSPAFSIAVNDPFHWLLYRPLNDVLLVARANVFFSLSFWMFATAWNLHFLDQERRRQERRQDSRVPLPDVIWQYLTKDSFSEPEILTLCAGMLFALGIMFQLQGGMAAGFVTSELVQASPLILFVWNINAFGDLKNFMGNREELHLDHSVLLISMTGFYIVGTILFLTSSTVRPGWVPF